MVRARDCAKPAVKENLTWSKGPGFAPGIVQSVLWKKTQRNSRMLTSLQICSFQTAKLGSDYYSYYSSLQATTWCNYKYFMHLGVIINYDSISHKTHKQDTCKTLSHRRGDLNPVSGILKVPTTSDLVGRALPCPYLRDKINMYWCTNLSNECCNLESLDVSVSSRRPDQDWWDPGLCPSGTGEFKQSQERMRWRKVIKYDENRMPSSFTDWTVVTIHQLFENSRMLGACRSAISKQLN